MRLNTIEKNYADRGEFYPPRCKTVSEICIIHTKRKASSIIVSLFIQNTSKFLTTFPLRRLQNFGLFLRTVSGYKQMFFFPCRYYSNSR